MAELNRARDQGLDVHPGQDIGYVVGDEKSSCECIALTQDKIETYDAT
jgi:hypothetical protein